MIFCLNQNEAHAELSIDKIIPINDLNIFDVSINPKTDTAYLTGSNSLIVVNLKDNSTENIKVSTYPYKIAINPTNDKAYVTSYCNCPDGYKVTVLDVSASKPSIITTIDVKNNQNTIAINPKMERVYVTSFSNSGSGSIIVIDSSTNKIIDEIIGIDATQLAINENTNTVYAISKNHLYIIDGSTNKIKKTITIDLPPDNEFTAVGNKLDSIAVNPYTNVIYLINEVLTPPQGPTEGEAIPVAYLVAVDGSSNSIINLNMMQIFGFSFGIDINPTTNRLYVQKWSGFVTMDVTTNKIVNNYFEIKNDIRKIMVEPETGKIYGITFQGLVVMSDTETVPEFGSLTGMIIALSIIGVVLISRKFNYRVL